MGKGFVLVLGTFQLREPSGRAGRAQGHDLMIGRGHKWEKLRKV